MIYSFLCNTHPYQAGSYRHALQFMIIQTDILIGSIFHTKTFRYRSNLYKTQSFVQMTSMNIIFHYSIELQNSKAMLLCLHKTISYQFFTDMLATTICSNSVTCICNMPAAADIVWMQDIESHNFSIVICNTTICLCSKKSQHLFYRSKNLLVEKPRHLPQHYSRYKPLQKCLFPYTF